MVLFIRVFNLVFSYKWGEYKAVDNAQKIFILLYTTSLSKKRTLYKDYLSFGREGRKRRKEE